MELHRVVWPAILVVAFLVSVLVSLAEAQTGPFPQRINVPGAIRGGGGGGGGGIPAAHPQFRNEKLVRVRRPTALRSQSAVPLGSPTAALTPRIIEEAKPVTELPEDEVSPSVDDGRNAFLPHLLREQQLAQAQQAQFQQAAAAFLNGDANALQDSPTLLSSHQEDVGHLPPRFQDRPAPTPIARPVFNDYGIGAGLSATTQRFVPSQPAPAPPPPPPPSQPAAQRFNTIRSRPPVREQRPQYEPPTPIAPVRTPRPKPIQSRPIIEQNQLQHEERIDSPRRQRPVAQTIRKWREENEDGSITWGYENDDGSFKEELIGTDCITKGTYGYIDPDGNKREYHYETGIKCDPNARNNEEDDYEQNGFINYEENKAVLPNGIEIDMAQLGKKKSRRPSINYN